MNHDFSKAASLRDLPLNRQRVQASMNFLADMMKDGRPFLMGRHLSAADLCAYHPLWFTRKNGGAEAEALLKFAPLDGWMQRVAACGHGKRSDIGAEEALAAAKRAEPVALRGVAANDPCGLKAGAAVIIRTEERGDPIRGALVGADDNEIVIAPENPRIGRVHVHFPRFGYSAVAA